MFKGVLFTFAEQKITYAEVKGQKKGLKRRLKNLILFMIELPILLEHRQLGCLV
jgi:hypothetical protein